MDEQNSLHIISFKPMDANENFKKNLRGRPRKTQSLVFSTQPRSIVSRMLQKMITKNKVVIPIEGNTSKNKSVSLRKEQIEYDSNDLALVEESDYSSEEYYPNPKKLDNNMEKGKVGPKTYACNFLNCTYNTKMSCNLQKHKRTHTGEKPYLCERCSFRTNFSNSLRVHRRLHTDERPYQCKQCDYKCNSISNLKKHSFTKHKNMDDSNKVT